MKHYAFEEYYDSDLEALSHLTWTELESMTDSEIKRWCREFRSLPEVVRNGGYE